MATGIVKWYNDEKGYGFIIPDGKGPDVFVHVRDLQESQTGPVRANQRLSFDVIRGRDEKPKAVNIRAI